MEKLYKRGIHDENLLNSLKNEEDKEGVLYPLIELVRKSKDLVLQIRDNYFNTKVSPPCFYNVSK